MSSIILHIFFINYYVFVFCKLYNWTSVFGNIQCFENPSIHCSLLVRYSLSNRVIASKIIVVFSIRIYWILYSFIVHNISWLFPFFLLIHNNIFGRFFLQSRNHRCGGRKSSLKFVMWCMEGDYNNPSKTCPSRISSSR